MDSFARTNFVFCHSVAGLHLHFPVLPLQRVFAELLSNHNLVNTSTQVVLSFSFSRTYSSFLLFSGDICVSLQPGAELNPLDNRGNPNP